MIKYDYEIRRNESDEEVIYEPKNYPTQLPNLVFIEGPNDSGKSTLLNLIALSCFALNDPNLKASLRKKIEPLSESDHQELDFEIEISDSDNNVQLSAKKEANKPVSVRDNKGKLVTSDRFFREYRLIYDIPENPTERLPELLKDIRSTQLIYSTRLAGLRNQLLNVIREIEDSRDPEKIENYKSELASLTYRRTKTNDKIPIILETLKEIKTFTYLKQYDNYSKKHADLLKVIAEHEKKERKGDREKIKRTQQQASIEDEIRELTLSCENAKHELTQNLEPLFGKGNTKNHFDIWNESNIRHEIDSKGHRNDLKVEAEFFLKKINKMQQELTEQSDFDKVHLYKELVKLLDQYKDSDIQVPATSLPIVKFLSEIKTELKKLEGIEAKVRTYGIIQDYLEMFLEKRKNIIEDLIPALGRISVCDSDMDSDDYTQFTEDNSLSDLREKCKATEKKLIYYRSELSHLKIDESDVRSLYASVVLGRSMPELEGYKEAELLDRISDHENQIKDSEKEITKLEANIEVLEKQISRLEGMERHKYEDNKQDLQNLLKTVQLMETRLATVTSYLDEVIDSHKRKKINFTADINEYLDMIYKYLGKRVGIIKYTDGEYKVEKIDVIKDLIVTTGGKTIKLSDMGTGRGQSAYLKALLGDYDGRKIIALFDEVAMMDQKSLESIFERIRLLYGETKLLASVVVQRGDSPKWSEI